MFSGNNPQSTQQSPTGINFGQLDPIRPTDKIVAQLPQQGGGSDIGSLLQGLASVVTGASSALGMGGNAPKVPPQPQTTQSSQLGQYVNNQITGQGTPNTTQGRMGQIVNNSGIFNNAMKEMGLNAQSPALQHYLAKANPNLDPTTTPWCAGFVGSVLNASGVNGTGSLAAKSYLNYGKPTTNPSQGDIVVFNDMTGRNDPAHGHVGFVDHIDQQNGLVYTLGGNQSGQVSIKGYPISSVAGFRQPPTGDQVRNTAQQNGIQNPTQLANLTAHPNPQQQVTRQNSPQGNPNMNQQTLDTIKHFEDFNGPAAWDVNAYRAGWGSDTYTTADGKVHQVTSDTVVSREDADRDLNRRAQEFENTAKGQVGEDAWGNLSPGAQSALTSIAYNYGSLPKRIIPAVKSGDPNAIAEAVRGLGGDNHGINRSRRNQEANMIQNGMKSSDNSPQQQPQPPTPQEQKDHDEMSRFLDHGKDDYAALVSRVNDLIG